MGGKPTLFRFLVHESGLAPEDLSTERLQKEAMVLLGGGTTTTARTATMTCFWMLSMPEKGQRLRDELKDIMAEYPKKKPSLTELEKLPYLGAVIQESLRYVHPPDGGPLLSVLTLPLSEWRMDPCYVFLAPRPIKLCSSKNG